MRTPSSVTAATDSSPQCVGSVEVGGVGEEYDGTTSASGSGSGSKRRSSGGTTDSPRRVAAPRNLAPTFTTVHKMVDDSSRAVEEADAASSARVGDEEMPSDDAPFEEDEGYDDGENHEVELKDVEGLFHGGASDEEDKEEMPVKKKTFMSHVKLNPKLKNFMMSTLTIGKDGSGADCDESVEISLLGEQEGPGKPSVAGKDEPREENLETMKEDGSSTGDRLEAIEELPQAGGSKGEEEGHNSTTKDTLESASDEYVLDSEPSEKDGSMGKKKLVPLRKLNSKLKSFISPEEEGYDSTIKDTLLDNTKDEPVSDEYVLDSEPSEKEGSRGKKKLVPLMKLNSRLKSFISSKVLDTTCEESYQGSNFYVNVDDDSDDNRHVNADDDTQVEISNEVVSCRSMSPKEEVARSAPSGTGDEPDDDDVRLHAVKNVSRHPSTPSKIDIVQSKLQDAGESGNEAEGDDEADAPLDYEEKAAADDYQVDTSKIFEASTVDSSTAPESRAAKAGGSTGDLAVEDLIRRSKMLDAGAENRPSESFEGEYATSLERPKTPSVAACPPEMEEPLPATGNASKASPTLKKLMSRVKSQKLKSPKKLKSFGFSKSKDERDQEPEAMPNIRETQDMFQMGNDEVEPSKVVLDDAQAPQAVLAEDELGPAKDDREYGIEPMKSFFVDEGASDDDDDGDDEFNMSNVDENENKSRSVKSARSGLNMSVFGRTRSGSRSKSATTQVEKTKDEKPFEFRQMKVTLKFKALAGVSSQNRSDDHEGKDETVKAVVTYRRNTIASDRFVSTHVPSLPILRESTPDPTNMQVYAQWPGWKQNDDDSTTASGMMMSSVTLTRTVRRARHFDHSSSVGTAGGSGAKEPEDGKRFLASLSKAFAPELLDLQIGLMRGSSEIIPLGVATVVLPGEYQRMQLDIPVVRNYSTGEKKSKGVTISQLGGKTKAPQDHVFFSADKETKYKIHEGAFLRLELNVEPALEVPATSMPSRHLNTNTRKAQFRSGPINQAIRRRRKMDHLLIASGHKKLPLHQRVQLYLEIRNRKVGSRDKDTRNSQEICISRQTEVSEVSCPVPSDIDDASASLLVDQYDMRQWASGTMETMEEHSVVSNTIVRSKSLIRSKSASAQPVSVAKGNQMKGGDDVSLGSRQSNVSVGLSSRVKGAPSASVATTTDMSRQDEILSVASHHSNATADTSSLQPKEATASLTSVASLLYHDEAGRLTPASHTDHDDDLSQFSSSLHSVFTTNHPQKLAVAQDMMELLGCDPNLILCEEERNALKYYAYDPEQNKCAHYCMTPFLEEDMSIPDTDVDEDSSGSLESVPVKVNRRRDPFVVDS